MKVNNNQFNSISYSLGERLLRLAVFQAGIFCDLFERIVLCVYNFFSKFSCTYKILDPERAEKALQSYENLGANIEFITPQDGKAKIQMMHLRAEEFEKKIISLGATWQKIIYFDNEISKSIQAIIPPTRESIEWKEFEKNISMFRWEKKVVEINGDKKEVIITCENADIIEEQDCYKNLFFHCKSAGVSFIMLGRRAGFYLGCKQDVCLYDSRGTWKSTGVASEGGYYNDATAVFEKIQSHYDSKNIWVTSTCGGAAPAAHLKASQHTTGVNFIFENGFSNMKRDFISHQNFIVRKFADHFWDCLSSKDIDETDKPKETGFDIHKLWEDLVQTDIGKVIVITVKNDQLLPDDVAKRNVELAERINTNVSHIVFESLQKNSHTDRYFNHPMATTQVLSTIFKS